MKLTAKVCCCLAAGATFIASAADEAWVTNDLSAVLLQLVKNPANPFTDANGGTWSFKTGSGVLLVTGYAPVTGMAGLYGLNIGAYNYPLVSVNTTDANVSFSSGEEPYAPGEVRVHPGNSQDLDVVVEYTPPQAGRYTVEGSVRATNTGWSGTVCDGIALTDGNGFLTEPVITTADRTTKNFSSNPRDVTGSITFRINMRTAHSCDATAFALRIVYVGEEQGGGDEHDDSVISEVFNVAMRNSQPNYGDTIETTYMDVTVGKSSTPDGTIVALPHGTHQANPSSLVGWQDANNGTSNPTYPRIFANVAGSVVSAGDGIRMVGANEIWLHPGVGLFAKLRFTSKIAGDYTLCFDVIDGDDRGGEGIVAYVYVNGERRKSQTIGNGGSAQIRQALPGLKAGDAVDLAVGSLKDGGKGIQCDATNLKVTLEEGYEPEEEPDATVLQRLLDAGGDVVFPSGSYEIDRPLVIRSGTTLTCEEGTTLTLAAGANCPILVNEHHASGTDGDITVSGGVWNGQNILQTRTAYLIPETFKYGQFIMLSGVTNLVVRDLKVVNPQGFSIQLTDVENFLVENIVFDCDEKTPNEDGVHVNGFARHGVIRNLSGQTGDDLVALNADEGGFRSADNDISDITIDTLDGGDNGYTAVRLLSRDAAVSNVTIRNVSGKFRYYIVSFTHWAQSYRPGMGHFDNIVIEDVTAASAQKSGGSPTGLIWFQDGVSDVGDVTIRNLSRIEGVDYQNAIATIHVDKNVHIDRLELKDVFQSVSGQQERLKIDPTATVVELVDTETPVSDSVRGWGPVVRPPQTPVAKTVTNDLAEALRTWLVTRENPVVTPGGTWEFARANGEKLAYPYDRANGVKGVQYAALGSADTYPKLYVNAGESDAPAEDPPAALALHPGEVYMHPGSVPDHHLRITFTPTAPQIFSIVGQVRSVNSNWGTGDGVVFSGSQIGHELFSVQTTSDCAAHAFSVTGVEADANAPLVFLLDRRTTHSCDATGANLALVRMSGKTLQTRSYRSASVSSNVNEIARKAGLVRYPDAFVINGLGVSFGRTSAIDGTMEPMGRHIPDSAFVGWRNGSDSSYSRTPETYTKPDAYLNVSGRTISNSTTYNTAVRADEWMLHPGLGRYSVVRFKPRQGFRRGDYALVFGLRDLLVSGSGNSKGVECFFVRNGEPMWSGVVADGSEAQVTAEIPDFKAGDTFDLVIRSTYDGGQKVDSDLTAVSVEMRRMINDGLILFVQ